MLTEHEYDQHWLRNSVDYQPWTAKQEQVAQEQDVVRRVISSRCNAKIGENVYIAPSATIITNRLVIGDRSWIAAGAIIRGDVEMGFDCSINPNAHLAGLIRIGSAVRIAAGANIYGFNHGADRTDIPIFRQPVTIEGVHIGDDVWIGAATVILDGVQIGSHSIVAAGSIVTRSCPPLSVLAGNPARVIRLRRNSPSPGSQAPSDRP